MDKQEFDNWARFTMGNPGSWRVEPVMTANGRFTVFCPLPTQPEDGIYVQIADGVLECGRYEGALPCLSDALFKPKVTKTFPTNEDAHKHAIERLGLSFLFAYTHGTSPYRSL